MDNYRNFGITILNDRPCEDEATIIVVGVPRSGTSMIAASLIALGVPMGDRMDDAVYEDTQMAGALDKPEALARAIGQRNAKFPKWGFKRPLAFVNMAKDLRSFRKPRLVIPFRDSAAIAMRNVISMRFDFVPALGLAVRQTVQLSDFIRDVTVPTMVVSYEKAISNPSVFTEELSTFCAVENKPAALEVIVNGPPRYLEKARLKD